MQVFGIYMHLKHAAGQWAAEQINRHAQNADDKLSEFCSAVEAVTDEELLQLGLPVLRSTPQSLDTPEELIAAYCCWHGVSLSFQLPVSPRLSACMYTC